jgi:Zn-dependent protease
MDFRRAFCKPDGMDFLSYGIPVGRYWGITVRLHFTFVIFVVYRLQYHPKLAYGLAFVVGLYLCILLHEFGHALAARWCDGEADEILLWPLGGLAFVRPAWNPTAHLITTVAGPAVTLALWLAFWGGAGLLQSGFNHGLIPLKIAQPLYWFVATMRDWNLFLLVFNLIPAFPMDGGRILRDSLWHRMSAETATRVAIVLSNAIAVLAVVWAVAAMTGAAAVPWLPFSPVWLIVLAVFIFTQATHELQIVAMESRGAYGFSVRERLHRARRQHAFRGAVHDTRREQTVEAFHRCHVCGRTERDSRALEFRVCPDCANGEEYCQEHLHHHPHTR